MSLLIINPGSLPVLLMYECRDPSLISHIGATLVKGTIRRWEPRLLEAIHQRPISSSRGKKESTGKGKGKGATGLLSQVDQQAEEDFKEALRVSLILFIRDFPICNVLHGSHVLY